MTKIESELHIVKAKDEQVFNFLTNFNHFQKLMPEQIVNWQSTEENCSFTIQGMADIRLKIAEKIPFSKIVMGPDGKTSIQYALIILITPQQEANCGVQIVFEADLNPVMSMMAGGPLKNFVNMLAQRLQVLFENGNPLS